MAEVLRDMGRTPEALKEYTRAFHLKPNMVEALVPLCELRLTSADRELGLSFARMAVLAAPHNEKVHRTLIEALIATDRLEEAEKELAPQLATANPDVQVLAYKLSRKKRDLSAAGRHLDEAIRMSPRDTQLLLLRCDLLEAVDDCPRALETLERAIALEPKSTEVHLRLASHLENHDLDFPQAVKEYRTVLQLDPDCVPAVCGIARCDSKSKDATVQLQILVEKRLASMFNLRSQLPTNSRH